MDVIKVSHLNLRMRSDQIPIINSATRHPLPTEHLYMNLSRLSLSSIVVSALVTLSACGGGGSSYASGNGTETAAASFATKVSAAYTSLAASSGLTSAALADLFNANYLDMAFNKTSVLAVFKANSDALATTPELSLFPLAQVTNPVITFCDGNNVCTLNATLVNSDADTTSVDFSTKVIIVSGVVYFYGDQSSTPSI
jgi:hypothetical protein